MAQRTPPPPPTGPPPTIEASVTAVVVREYTPLENNHISLAVGDTIKVTDFGEKLFWYGTSGSGAQGLFPSSHVEIRGRGRGRGGLTRPGRGGSNEPRGRHSSYVPSNPTPQTPPTQSPTTSPLNSPSLSPNNSPNVPLRPKSGYTSSTVEEPTPTVVPRSPLRGGLSNSVNFNSNNHVESSPPTRGIRGRGRGAIACSDGAQKAAKPFGTPPALNNNNNNNNNVNNNVNSSDNNSNMSPIHESPVVAPNSPSVDPKKKTREDLRRDTLQELYETEKSYIEDLETMINVFIFPLRTMSVLPESTLYNIFSNVEVLINCNREMLKALEEKMGDTQNGEALIGSCFTMLADYFKMYKVYCANQSTSLTTVDTQLKKTAQFKKNLEICHSDPRCRGLFLQSFLIKPIQRVCKYPLLLRELIRYTPEDHPDYEPLQSAFTKINEVVTNINEGQREAEGLQRILDLQKLIDGIDTLVEPGRRFHKEGELTFFKNVKSKHGEKRHVFFFSDLILLTTRKGEKRYEHKLSIPLGNCTLIVLADSQHIKNAFELSQKSLKHPCILSGDTPEELNQWTKEIKNLIKLYQKKEIELKKKGISTIDDTL